MTGLFTRVHLLPSRHILLPSSPALCRTMVRKSKAGISFRTLKTVHTHADEGAPLTLFGSCFCPFVQQAWVALEYSQLNYQYYEMSTRHEKPKDLLEVSARGLVPGLRLNDTTPPRAVAESSIVMEYIDELAKSGKRDEFRKRPALV